MDARLQEIIYKKINEVLANPENISQIIESLKPLSFTSTPFAHGVIIGRLYNSFNYQCRRILKRDPTSQEFAEFLKILHDKQTEFIDKIRFDK